MVRNLISTKYCFPEFFKLAHVVGFSSNATLDGLQRLSGLSGKRKSTSLVVPNLTEPVPFLEKSVKYISTSP